MGMILLVDRHFEEQKNWNVKVVIKRNALIETLGIHRVCNSQVKVTNNPSQ